MYNPPPPYSQNPEEGPDSRTEKINALWKIVSGIYVFAALGLCFYWEFKDSGLCLVVRGWQSYISSDTYSRTLDILLAWLMLIIPLFIAKLIVEKATGVKIKTNYKK